MSFSIALQHCQNHVDDQVCTTARWQFNWTSSILCFALKLHVTWWSEKGNRRCSNSCHNISIMGSNRNRRLKLIAWQFRPALKPSVQNHVDGQPSKNVCTLCNSGQVHVQADWNEELQLPRPDWACKHEKPETVQAYAGRVYAEARPDRPGSINCQNCSTPVATKTKAFQRVCGHKTALLISN